MSNIDKENIIGYSGFDPVEDCYEYNENSCYIADTPELAKKFIMNSFMYMGEYRIDPVSIKMIMDDYGCSCGEYAMEESAFSKFKSIAEQKGIKYKAEKFDYDYPLMIVDVEGVNISNEY